MGRRCGRRQTLDDGRTRKKGTPKRPLLGEQRTYLFFAAFFFPPLAFFAIEDSSLHWWIAGASRRRTLPPGTSARRSATSLRGLTPDRDARIRSATSRSR